MQELNYLKQLDKFGVQPGLERIELLLDYLDNPEEELNIIHIAGTNGKGSTAALLTSIYKEAGYKVGTYNSPEIVEFNERIRINDTYISDDRLATLIQELKPVIQKVENELAHPTFFEVVTAAAILYFAQEKVDLAILEVGMGGRFDATNVGQSLLSVITNVSLDHKEYLGDDLSEITLEKGGIIEEDQPVITAANKEEVKDKLAEIAAEKEADLINVNDYFFWDKKETPGRIQKLDISGLRRTYKDLVLPLLGSYQITNTVTAIGVVEILYNKYPIAPKFIKEGINKVEWPGRLEVVSEEPLIILDGAHNQAGAKQLCIELQKLNYERLILVLSFLGDKDYQSMIDQLINFADKLILSQNNNPRAASVEKLFDYAQNYEADIELEEDLIKAVDYALKDAAEKDLILIGGSLYTVSQIREKFML